MPSTEVLLDQLGEAQYLSSLDLMKGYRQVPLRPEDREKTAFATPLQPVLVLSHAIRPSCCSGNVPAPRLSHLGVLLSLLCCIYRRHSRLQLDLDGTPGASRVGLAGVTGGGVTGESKEKRVSLVVPPVPRARGGTETHHAPARMSRPGN